MKPSTLLAILAVGAVIGLVIFGSLVRSRVSVETVPFGTAIVELEWVRMRHDSRAPWLQRDAAGTLVPATPPAAPGPVRRLRFLALQRSPTRLARGDVPFWFVKLKGPALRLALRGAGIDLGEMGITAADLEAYGPGIVLDETRGNGDQLLIWTE